MSGDDDNNVIRFPTLERTTHLPFFIRAYDLVDREPVALKTMKAWAYALLRRSITEKRSGVDPWRVDETIIGPARVITVFVGLDHNSLGSGPPVVFATMIVGGSHDGLRGRCSTWGDAEAMHAGAVKQVRGCLFGVTGE